ncbi:helix-turn-helix domain-containing protein [uncultured Maricaulis sp.]|uniref:AraC-like ligand-binding domain-containing protein n=1 Tax=uncultured Maricaulis sp. TaxID=174710 RepID=UPI0026228112|nr:helix-turn-helix domain-containing protein [uncultured Maricaulis sp.]
MSNTTDHSYFDTSSLAPSDRFSIWREAIDVCFEVNPHRSGHTRPFNACVESFLLEDIAVNHCRLGAQEFRRDPARIARDGIDNYQLHIFLNGQAEMKCAGRAVESGAGDFVVLDQADEFYSWTSNYEIINAFIPRRRLAPLLQRPDATHGLVFDGHSGAGMLLKEFLVSLFKVARDLPDWQISETAKTLVNLAAMALNGAQIDLQNPPKVYNRSILMRAQIFMKEHLHNPDLSVSHISAHLSVSRSKLYELFREFGGVKAYLRELRLRRAFSELAAFSGQPKSISHLAFTLGFSDPAVFSRQFKFRFGISPTEARSESQTANDGRALSNRVGDVKYADWIRQIA